jgi:hypothetical protein
MVILRTLIGASHPTPSRRNLGSPRAAAVNGHWSSHLNLPESSAQLAHYESMANCLFQMDGKGGTNRPSAIDGSLALR